MLYGVGLPQLNLNDHHPRQLRMEIINPKKDDLKISCYGASGSSEIDRECLAFISKTSLSVLILEIPRLAKDQYGCRFLQKRIDPSIVTNTKTRRSNFKIIFGEIKDLFYDLIIDPYGNYLIQRLIDYCSEEDLDHVVESLSSELYLISVNQHGTRALQKIIEKMSNGYQLSLLVQGLGPHIIKLIKNLNGNHVIQKILNKYLPEKCQFIYDSIVDNLLVVATHKHGCCVLQKCLNHVNADQLAEFADAILECDTFSRLVNDQFGNYVLQYLISINCIEVDCRLFQNLASNGLRDLCNLKFSSNVIEKLMKNCYMNEPVLISFSELKFSIIRLILATDINKIINDPYGNYVAQTMIDVLIHSNVNYYVKSPSGLPQLLPGLRALLGDNNLITTNSSILQVEIIKQYFGSCRIVSSFGKRIQLKIATILNGNSKPFSQRRAALMNQTQAPQKFYRQSRYEVLNPDEFSSSNYPPKGSIAVFDNRAYSHPLLNLTAQGSYSLRPQNYCAQQFSAPSLLQRRLEVSQTAAYYAKPSESNGGSMYAYSSRAPGTHLPPDLRTQSIILQGFKENNTYYREPELTNISGLLHQKMGGYQTPSMNQVPHFNPDPLHICRPTFGSGEKADPAIPPQNIDDQGRSGSQDGVNVTTFW